MVNLRLNTWKKYYAKPTPAPSSPEKIASSDPKDFSKGVQTTGAGNVSAGGYTSSKSSRSSRSSRSSSSRSSRSSSSSGSSGGSSNVVSSQTPPQSTTPNSPKDFSESYTPTSSDVSKGGYTSNKTVTSPNYLFNPTQTQTTAKAKLDKKISKFQTQTRKLTSYEEKVSERSKKASEGFRYIPGLRGDSYGQKFGREILAFPVRATIGFAETATVAVRKTALGVKGSFLNRKTSAYTKEYGLGAKKSNVKSELVRTAKETPKAIARAYDPRNPEGLANIVATIGAVYVLGSAKASSRAIQPSKMGVKPSSVKTSLSPKGQKAITVEQGSYISKSGSKVTYNVKSSVSTATGKGSFKLSLRNYKGKVITKKGSFSTKTKSQTPTSSKIVTTVKPRGFIRRTKEVSETRLFRTTPKNLKSSNSLTFKQTTQSLVKRSGRVKENFRTTRSSNFKVSGKKVVSDSGYDFNMNKVSTTTFKPSKIIESKINQATVFKPSKFQTLKKASIRASTKKGRVSVEVFPGSSFGASLISEYGKSSNFGFSKSGLSSKPKTSNFKVSAIPKSISPTLFIKSAILSSPKPVLVGVNPSSFANSNSRGNILSPIKSGFDSKPKVDVFTQPKIDVGVDSVVEPSVDPVVEVPNDYFSDSPVGINTITNTNVVNKYSSFKTFVLPPFLMPKISIGGGVGSYKPRLKRVFKAQSKAYTPSFTAGAFNIKAGKKKSKTGSLSGLGLRGIR